MSEQRFEDILDECINRMLGGESWQQVIAAYPQHAAELLPALKGAEAASRLQWSAPSASARAAAQRSMLNEVAGTSSAAGNTVKGGVVMGVTQWFRLRPPAARFAAVGAAAVMFGAVTMGAAAATGNAPQPVRSLFGVSDSVIRVEFTGTVVSIDGLTLTVDANGDLRTVVVSDSTRFGDDDDDARSIADFASGDLVKVEGRLQLDNSVLASRVRFDDDDSSTPGIGDVTTTPSPAETPAGQPTPVATQDDDDDDFDDDNSGPGDDDDDFGDDNSGPGGGDDDFGDDNSGPGGGDDDDGIDDDSGSGNDDDDDGIDDDNSGSGSDDDNDDDSSGSGSDDDDDDDSSGSGSDDDDEPDDD